MTDSSSIATMYFKGLARHYGFSLDTPVEELPHKALDVLLYGTKGERIRLERTMEYGSGKYLAEFEGVINNLERRYRETSSDWMRYELEQYMSRRTAPSAAAQGSKRPLRSPWAA